MKHLLLTVALFLLLAALCGCALLPLAANPTPTPTLSATETPPAPETPLVSEATPLPAPTKEPLYKTNAPSGGGGKPDAAVAAPTSSVSREDALSVLTMNQPAPDFTLKTLAGEEVSLSDYQGKIVFLTFWQTWCGPCRMEMPYFEKLMQENSDVVVVAVASLIGESAPYAQAEQDIREYIQEGGFTFPVLIDPAKQDTVSSMEAYASQYIPVNLAIDKQGNIRYRQDGAYSEEGLPILLDYMRALDE